MAPSRTTFAFGACPSSRPDARGPRGHDRLPCRHRPFRQPDVGTDRTHVAMRPRKGGLRVADWVMLRQDGATRGSVGPPLREPWCCRSHQEGVCAVRRRERPSRDPHQYSRGRQLALNRHRGKALTYGAILGGRRTCHCPCSRDIRPRSIGLSVDVGSTNEVA